MHSISGRRNLTTTRSLLGWLLMAMWFFSLGNGYTVSKLAGGKLVIEIGLPKSGTTSMMDGFAKLGMTSLHYHLPFKYCEGIYPVEPVEVSTNNVTTKWGRIDSSDGCYVGTLIQKSISQGKKPFQLIHELGTSKYDEYFQGFFQIDVCRPKPYNFCRFMQVFGLDQLTSAYPDAKYIMNVRGSLEQQVASMHAWADMINRYDSFGLLNMFPGQSKSKSMMENAVVLLESFENITRHLFTQVRPDLHFLEVNLEEIDAAQRIASFVGGFDEGAVFPIFHKNSGTYTDGRTPAPTRQHVSAPFVNVPSVPNSHHTAGVYASLAPTTVATPPPTSVPTSVAAATTTTTTTAADSATDLTPLQQDWINLQQGQHEQQGAAQQPSQLGIVGPAAAPSSTTYLRPTVASATTTATQEPSIQLTPLQQDWNTMQLKSTLAPTAAEAQPQPQSQASMTEPTSVAPSLTPTVAPSSTAAPSCTPIPAPTNAPVVEYVSVVENSPQHQPHQQAPTNSDPQMQAPQPQSPTKAKKSLPPSFLMIEVGLPRGGSNIIRDAMETQYTIMAVHYTLPKTYCSALPLPIAAVNVSSGPDISFELPYITSIDTCTVNLFMQRAIASQIHSNSNKKPFDYIDEYSASAAVPPYQGYFQLDYCKTKANYSASIHGRHHQQQQYGMHTHTHFIAHRESTSDMCVFPQVFALDQLTGAYPYAHYVLSKHSSTRAQAEMMHVHTRDKLGQYESYGYLHMFPGQSTTQSVLENGIVMIEHMHNITRSYFLARPHLRFLEVSIDSVDTAQRLTKFLDLPELLVLE